MEIENVEKATRGSWGWRRALRVVQKLDGPWGAWQAEF